LRRFFIYPLIMKIVIVLIAFLVIGGFLFTHFSGPDEASPEESGIVDEVAEEKVVEEEPASATIIDTPPEKVFEEPSDVSPPFPTLTPSPAPPPVPVLAPAPVPTPTPLPAAEPVTKSATILDFAFHDAEIRIPVGSTIIWTNQDSAGHTVTSDNGRFTSSSLLLRGNTYQHTFTEKGEFTYHCSPHPFMKGKIIVE